MQPNTLCTPETLKCQFSLTVPEGKRLIAKAVATLPEVRHALQNGIILLKGGTTVSAIAEELCGQKMRISGRISPRGTVSIGAKNPGGTHAMILRKGTPEAGEGKLMETALAMGPEDVAISSANIFDIHGRAAIMAGKDLGGEIGSVYPSLEAEGVRCITAAGLEKLSPQPLEEAARHAGRKAVDWSMGMAVGLILIPGEIVTEVEALNILGFKRHWLVGRGGMSGAEGGCTFLVEDTEERARKLVALIDGIKGATDSATEDSIPECLTCGPTRKFHLACAIGGKERVDLRKN